MKAKEKGVSEESFVGAVKRLREERVISLELPVPEVDSLAQYFLIAERSIWFHLVLALTLVTLLSIYVVPDVFPFVMLRWIMGSVFVLFLPGYVSVQALFPSGKDLDEIERFALSVGLSLALTPLIGLLLNYTPWGIRLNPIMVSLCLFTFTVAFVGVYREYRRCARRARFV